MRPRARDRDGPTGGPMRASGALAPGIGPIAKRPPLGKAHLPTTPAVSSLPLAPSLALQTPLPSPGPGLATAPSLAEWHLPFSGISGPPGSGGQPTVIATAVLPSLPPRIVGLPPRPRLGPPPSVAPPMLQAPAPPNATAPLRTASEVAHSGEPGGDERRPLLTSFHPTTVGVDPPPLASPLTSEASDRLDGSPVSVAKAATPKPTRGRSSAGHSAGKAPPPRGRPGGPRPRPPPARPPSEAAPALLAPASGGPPPLASTVPHARSLSPHLTGNGSARLFAAGLFRRKGTTRVVRPSGTDALAAGATKNSSMLDAPSTLCASTCAVLPSPLPASFAGPGCPRPRPSPVAA